MKSIKICSKERIFDTQPAYIARINCRQFLLLFMNIAAFVSLDSWSSEGVRVCLDVKWS